MAKPTKRKSHDKSQSGTDREYLSCHKLPQVLSHSQAVLLQLHLPHLPLRHPYFLKLFPSLSYKSLSSILRHFSRSIEPLVMLPCIKLIPSPLAKSLIAVVDTCIISGGITAPPGRLLCMGRACCTVVFGWKFIFKKEKLSLCVVLAINKGYITVPAGFKVYELTDLSTAQQYRLVQMDAEQIPKPGQEQGTQVGEKSCGQYIYNAIVL